MELKSRIAELISAPLLEHGFDLIEIKLSQFRQNYRLQVFIDSDKGVTLDDCASISRIIDGNIEGHNILKEGYTLEVSSPGLDRPLQKYIDFHRRIGDVVQIVFNDPAMPPLSGKLVSADNQYIELELEDGKRRLDLIDIKKGKIVI